MTNSFGSNAVHINNHGHWREREKKLVWKNELIILKGNLAKKFGKELGGKMN